MALDLSTLNERQMKIVKTLDAPLFVEAGAGSGKTFTLTRRLAWALSPGSGEDGGAFLDSLDQALVITFTNAAALEIKERVRSTLREAGPTQQALTVDDAWISTIHGMCSRILHRHALDLGLDPEFQMIEDNIQDLYWATSVERVLREAINEERVQQMKRFFGAIYPSRSCFSNRSGVSVAGLVEELVHLAKMSPGGFDSLVFPDASDVDAMVSDVLRGEEALLDARYATGVKPGRAFERDEKNIEVLRAYCSLPKDERSPQMAFDTLNDLPGPPHKSGKDGTKELAEELAGEIAYAKNAASLAVARDFADDLVLLARRVSAVYEDLKHRHSRLDNDDLIALTLSALKEHPEIARRYANKFRLVMIDEFQDTDARQVELISMLSGPDACRLVTVGDAQQSIYRFRGADVSVFMERGERTPAQSHCKLDVNYRSHPDVLSFVDRVFGDGRGIDPGLIPNFMSLAPNPDRDDGYAAAPEPRINVEVSVASNADNRVPALAAAIADRLAAYAAAGQDPGGMALLLGVTTNAATYIDALRARGLKCVVTGGSTFSDLAEVKVIQALLHVLANPRNTQDGLFPVLTSDLFRLDADDLCALGTRLQDKLPAPTKRRIDVGLEEFTLYGDLAASPRLARAHEVLMRAFQRLDTWDVADVCQAVVMESGWLQRLEAQGSEGRAQAANVLAAVRYIRELTVELGLGPARAAQEFDTWLKVAKVHPAILSGGEADAVRVMTIHASKGLEFPVVAVSECWKDAKAYSGIYHEEVEGEVRCVIVPQSFSAPKESPASAAECRSLTDIAAFLQTDTMRADDAEAVRLLYVGVTRAREALVLGIPATDKDLMKESLKASVLRIAALAELDDNGFMSGEHVVDYGGSQPARVRLVTVTYDKENDVLLADSGGTLEGFDGELEAEKGKIKVQTAQEERDFVLFDLPKDAGDVSFWGVYEDIFSYSSAHRILEHEARERGEAPVARTVREPRELDPLGPDEDGSPRVVVLDEEQLDAPGVSDADRATNLGSAFHQLAEAMVLRGGAVSVERVDAVARTWGLGPRQRARLDAALARWVASDVRAEALAWPSLRAEVPFFVPVDSRFGRYAEGAIDLLCTQEGSDAALVIDYKTGDAGLDAAQIRARHEQQANFYAHVLMGQGFSSVECAFVCVELDDGSGQPVVARYAFDESVPPTFE